MASDTITITATTSARHTKLDTRPRRLRSRSSAALKSTNHRRCNSFEPFDLSQASTTQTISSLRFLVLSYLATLERRLGEFESPDVEAWKTKGELKFEEVSQWARTAIDMLNGIRADVHSHFPEIHFADLTSVDSFIKTYLSEFPDMNNVRAYLPDMVEMRAHLPDMADVVRAHFPDLPQLPDMPDVRSHFPDFNDMRHKLETRLQDLDFQRPLSYIPTLSDHLQSLHSHLCSLEPLSTSFSLLQGTILADFLDSILSSGLVSDLIAGPHEVLEDDLITELVAIKAANAVKRSLHGMRLINYHDLPHPWKNNPFVMTGYRFIPLERWPLLLKSVFAWHNETLNIHTHLIPFVLWCASLFSLLKSPKTTDVPELVFMSFALLCLLSSAIWHTMSGCADYASMVFCARVDYVGIGWLISASVATIVHHGFQCHPHIGQSFLLLCLGTGLAGNIFPFMAWFNQHEYRFYRIGFFLSLAFSAIAPIVNLSLLHSWKVAWQFVSPTFPSITSYIVGLVFYASHVPERFLSDRIRMRLDCIGCNSHSIWHCFIVLAVSQHLSAIRSMKAGLECAI